MIKVLTVFGTRPEAIKMGPLVKELEKRPDEFESIVCVTAQHREMLDQVLDVFDITPDYDFNIMKPGQTLTEITANVLRGLEKVILSSSPDIILVHGDTTTTFAASLAAFYHEVMIGHVEAGLRTWDKYAPFPEEMNRQMTDVLSDLYFAPTEMAKENLLREGKPEAQIFVTGNTVIDALKDTVIDDYEHPVLQQVATDHKLILMTMHRRENQGAPMGRVFDVIRQLVDEESDIEVVFPVHLNPTVRNLADEILGEHDRIHLIEPLEVQDFHNFAARSYLIMSDSGGVQEEAPSLDVPVLVLRETTERPEGVAAGTLKLVGTDQSLIYDTVKTLLHDVEAYQEMKNAVNPYGDGTASQQICDCILKEYKKL